MSMRMRGGWHGIVSSIRIGLINATSETKLDKKARSSNLQQVADHIQSHSAGNAVVLTGDTNALYTSPDENIRVFEDQNRMTNPWVELIRNGTVPSEGSNVPECDIPTSNNTCQALDKILYVLLPSYLNAY